MCYFMHKQKITIILAEKRDGHRNDAGTGTQEEETELTVLTNGNHDQ